MAMAQLLRAVVVGLALATIGWLLEQPDWMASLFYVIGMGVTLMIGTTPIRFGRLPHWPLLLSEQASQN